MILSIIIPVYNVEKYIVKCLESCLIEDKSQYEIIIVNDGTKDNSIELISSIISKYSNITLITQHNQGLSAARNTGLAAAKGKYVWFIDSDDYIERSELPNIIETLRTNDVDLMHIKHAKVYENGTPLELVKTRTWNGTITGSRLIALGGLPAPIQFTIFNRRFLDEHQIKFVVGIYHEDSEFKPRAVFFAKSCLLYDRLVYYYLQRSVGSITSTFKLKNAVDLIYVMNSLFAFTCEQQMDDMEKTYFYRMIGLAMNSVLLGLRSLNSAENFEINSLLRQNKHLFKAMMHSKYKKYIVEGLLLQTNVTLAIKLHHFLR